MIIQRIKLPFQFYNFRYFSTSSIPGSGTIKSIKGCNDYFPDKKEQYNYVKEIGRNLSSLYGYREISTPIIEPYELFNRSVGEFSDIVQKEMYNWTDESGQRISLRPEGTAGVIRAIVQASLTNPALPNQRYFYEGPMFRYERPQKGRSRQFEQLGCELIGDSHPQSDVEIISMAWDFIQRFGIEKDHLSLRINSLGDQESITSYNQSLKQFYSKHKDVLSNDSKVRLERGNTLRILDSKDASDIEINKLAPILLDHLNTQSKDRYNSILRSLTQLEIPYQCDNSLVRGLDYYKHTIFEVVYKDPNQSDSIPLALLGGGRYDGLANQLGLTGSYILPSIGWATGIDRVLLFMNQDLLPKKSQPISIIITDSTMIDNAYKLCYKLRSQGFYVMIPSFDLENLTTTKQIKKADKLNSKYAIILGENEYRSNQVYIKDLSTSQQSLVNLSNIQQELKSLKY
ncbi:histidine-tRNA ligase [Tieghemostelium lacteum]|uniref:histidine--tRNA ligase n=1 Tax=Tieghemostelium lacteum TaxID=361077 RepID=A0A152A230_TIELA|nr:histidine-tRNA ligase [Tieghemostelium lacteum]|eukprot:KYR00270.1 histidine-tRNA ligase [Tieghemostelium lacteum]